MLITKLKDREKVREMFELYNPFVFKCFGCSEVIYPEADIDALVNENVDALAGIARIDYLCNESFARRYLENWNHGVEHAGAIVAFSCGVGVQVVSKLLEQKIVLPGCDTLYLKGFQGINVQEHDCEQCGECWLNLTGGICPLTACSKGLLNGPCGGTNDGKCEVDAQMDCGWALIYERLESTGKKELLKNKDISARDYSIIIKGGADNNELSRKT